jgi:hypothetical protein
MQEVVESDKIYAPSSNRTGIFPEAPPVPALTWASGFSGGSIPHATPSGTVVATLSGASTYSLLATSSPLSVSGSNVLMASSSPSNGAYNFYIEGFSTDGTPGIVPAYTATVGP